MKIKAYWITSDWKRENVLLDFSRVYGIGSASDLCEAFIKCLGQYEITLSQVLGVTLNSPPNVGYQFINSFQNHGNKSGADVSSAENKVYCLFNIMNSAVLDILSSLNCLPG